MTLTSPSGHSARRQRQPRSRRLRWFTTFVLLTLVVSAALLALVLIDETRENGADQTSTLSGDSLATITVFDVGQALSAAIITTDGASLVYDFGLSRAHIEEIVIPYLHDHGIEQVDYAILSHPHQDHLGGLPAFIEGMPIGLFIDPVLETTNQTYGHSLERIIDRDIDVHIARQGDTFSLGEYVDLEILWPTDDLLLDSDGTNRLNDNSTVVRASIGDIAVLLTGDIETEAEQLLAEQYGTELSIDILQVAHHGSRTSSTSAFLDASQPAVGIIPAGLDNRYGHPHDEVVERLRQHEIVIFRTDIDGTVIVETDGEQFTVTTERTDTSWQMPNFWSRLTALNPISTAPSWPRLYSMMGSN